MLKQRSCGNFLKYVWCGNAYRDYVTIQKGFDVGEVNEEVIEVLKRPECQLFIRKLESRGYVYEIFDIVTCMRRFSIARNTPVDSRQSQTENVDMHLDEMNMWMKTRRRLTMYR